MLVLLFVTLWVILRGDLLYVLPCVILFKIMFFSPFSIAITSLGEERELILVLLVVCSIYACLDLSVFSSSWCLGRAAASDCGTPWTFLLPFFHCMFSEDSDQPAHLHSLIGLHQTSYDILLFVQIAQIDQAY